MVRRRAGRGLRRLRGRSCEWPPSVPVSAGGSVRTSSGMLTVEMAREGIPITVIQRQLGHADLGVTSVYLRGIDNREIIETVHERHAPMMSANAGLRVGP